MNMVFNRYIVICQSSTGLRTYNRNSSVRCRDRLSAKAMSMVTKHNLNGSQLIIDPVMSMLLNGIVASYYRFPI